MYVEEKRKQILLSISRSRFNSIRYKISQGNITFLKDYLIRGVTFRRQNIHHKYLFNIQVSLKSIPTVLQKVFANSYTSTKDPRNLQTTKKSTEINLNFTANGRIKFFEDKNRESTRAVFIAKIDVTNINKKHI